MTIAALLLLVLKTVLYLVLAVLLLVFVILLIPIRALVAYNPDGLSVKLYLLRFFKVFSFPFKKKRKKSNDKEKKEKKKKSKNKEDTKKKSIKKQNVLEKLADILELLKAILPLAGKSLKKIFSAIRICDIYILLPVFGSDCDKTAANYGRISAALSSFNALFKDTFRVNYRKVKVYPDFLGLDQDKMQLSCCVNANLLSIAITGIWLFIQLKRNKIL